MLGTKEETHDTQVWLCVVVAGYDAELVVVVEDRRIVEDARCH